MAQRPFRIFALPLARLPRTRPPPPQATASPTTQSTSTAPTPTPPTPLVLFQVAQPDEAPPSTSSSRWTAVALTNRALNGASNQWLKLSTKPKDSWMYWFYAKGEGLMDKIEFEEWMLKGIHEGRGVKVVSKESGETQQKIEIALLRPELEEGPQLPPLVPRLHRMLAHRIPYHRKMMWRSIIFSPITWPFAIIPIIPNFPLFYVLWRAWSHYRAWRGAHYLEQLLQLGMIHETPSKELSEVYRAHGVRFGAEGEEDHAPDETVSKGAKPHVKPTKGDGGPGMESVADQVKAMRPQEKGEKEGSGDTTATPSSMVYTSSSLGSNISNNDDTASTRSKVTSAIRHPSLLLTHAQVPLLQRIFELRPNEIMDVKRAIDQADLRAKAIDRRNAMDTNVADKTTEPPTKWRGYLHR